MPARGHKYSDSGNPQQVWLPCIFRTDASHHSGHAETAEARRAFVKQRWSSELARVVMHGRRASAKYPERRAEERPISLRKRSAGYPRLDGVCLVCGSSLVRQNRSAAAAGSGPSPPGQRSETLMEGTESGCAPPSDAFATVSGPILGTFVTRAAGPAPSYSSLQAGRCGAGPSDSR